MLGIRKWKSIAVNFLMKFPRDWRDFILATVIVFFPTKKIIVHFNSKQYHSFSDSAKVLMHKHSFHIEIKNGKLISATNKFLVEGIFETFLISIFFGYKIYLINLIHSYS